MYFFSSLNILFQPKNKHIKKNLTIKDCLNFPVSCFFNLDSTELCLIFAILFT
jgi:hypothetical protein